jgi:hypothetical protein
LYHADVSNAFAEATHPEQMYYMHVDTPFCEWWNTRFPNQPILPGQADISVSLDTMALHTLALLLLSTYQTLCHQPAVRFHLMLPMIIRSMIYMPYFLAMPTLIGPWTSDIDALYWALS